jgi:hypothetical protein
VCIVILGKQSLTWQVKALNPLKLNSVRTESSDSLVLADKKERKKERIFISQPQHDRYYMIYSEHRKQVIESVKKNTSSYYLQTDWVETERDCWDRNKKS